MSPVTVSALPEPVPLRVVSPIEADAAQNTPLALMSPCTVKVFDGSVFPNPNLDSHRVNCAPSPIREVSKFVSPKPM